MAAAMDAVSQMNMQVMQHTMGSTDSVSNPFAQTFAPGAGQTPLANFMSNINQGQSQNLQNQTPLGQTTVGTQQTQPQNAQLGQLLQMLGQLLNNMAANFKSQPGYGTPTPQSTGQGSPMTQLQQLLSSLAGGDLDGDGKADLPATTGQQPQQQTQQLQQPSQQTATPLVYQQSPQPTICAPAPGQQQKPADAPMDDNEAKRVLAQNFEGMMGNDHKINKQDLQKAASGGGELGKAADYILHDKDLFRSIDTASQNKRGDSAKADGIIALDDMTTSLQDTDNAEGDAAVTSTFRKYESQLFPNGQLLTDDKIKSMAQPGGTMPNGDAVPADLQAACSNFLSKKSLMMKTDSAYETAAGKNTGGSIDHKYSADDFKNVVSSSLENENAPQPQGNVLLPTSNGQTPAAGNPLQMLQQALGTIGTQVTQPLTQAATQLAQPLTQAATQLTQPLTQLAQPLTQAATQLTQPLTQLAQPLTQATTQLTQPFQSGANFLSSFSTALAQHLQATGVSPQITAMVQSLGQAMSTGQIR